MAERSPLAVGPAGPGDATVVRRVALDVCGQEHEQPGRDIAAIGEELGERLGTWADAGSR